MNYLTRFINNKFEVVEVGESALDSKTIAVFEERHEALEYEDYLTKKQIKHQIDYSKELAQHMDEFKGFVKDSMIEGHHVQHPSSKAFLLACMDVYLELQYVQDDEEIK